PGFPWVISHPRLQRLQVFREMQIEDIRVRLRMLLKDLLDLRTKFCIREDGAERRVQDLPAGLGEAAQAFHIFPSLEVYLLELRLIEIRTGWSCGQRGADMIGRFIGVISAAREIDDLAEQSLIVTKHGSQGFEITRAGGLHVPLALGLPRE